MESSPSGIAYKIYMINMLMVAEVRENQLLL